MKKIFVVILFCAVAAIAGSEFGGVVPGSNEVGQSAAANPAAVAISSTTTTRIDSAVNTALSTALGTSYARSEVLVQVPDNAAVNCGFSVAVTTQPNAGFKFPVNATPMSFKMGKDMGIYCRGVVSTATFVVAGFGFK